MERSRHCPHTQSQRCLLGTWPTPELQEAVNQGYVIQHVYEVWHFLRNSNDMFSSYVDTGWVTTKTSVVSTSRIIEPRKVSPSRPTRSKRIQVVVPSPK